MKQSNNKKSRDVTAFLYERLSRDDNLEGESYSIGNQKKLLTKVAKEKGYTNLVHFMDDGISGVTMDRPGFVDMIRQLEEGRAAAVFVKDLSRLGRNYIEVGRLTEEFFPEHDIRLVAVSDNIDTAEGENELAPIRNLFNEWYARDISKKRRISNKIKGNAGEPMGQPPYGYMKDPDNPKRWIVDDEAALVVKRIYSMTLDGLGTEQIAAQLERDGILTPRAYWLQKGVKRPGKGKQLPPTRWNSSTITKILSLQEYCGDILNFKTYSKSYKNKKRIDNDRENWVVFKDVHEPIIDRAVWEQVQQKRGTRRRRRTNDGEKNMFSGLLVCADCGNNLHYHFNQGNPEIKYFNCSNYKGNRGTCTSTHYVRVDFLEQVVLGEIKRLTKFASHYEDDFVKAVMGSSQQSVALDRKLKEKELAALQARDEELDGLFERIYEDNVSGKLSDDRFSKMSRRYEDEQKEISERIKTLRAEMDKLSSKAVTADMFISTVRKYTRAKALTPRMLNELIDRIEVHQAEKINGEWVQHLTIHYNCVGAIFIPEVFPLPVPEVSVNTRKGVVVNYAPCQIAI
ncbi:MAG: recombinase family protein [Lachnospiraceae bacterium]|nr:recombinase family protein [Lachnospiraceae bacterium]